MIGVISPFGFYVLATVARMQSRSRPFTLTVQDGPGYWVWVASWGPEATSWWRLW